MLDSLHDIVRVGVLRMNDVRTAPLSNDGLKGTPEMEQEKQKRGLRNGRVSIGGIEGWYNLVIPFCPTQGWPPLRPRSKRQHCYILIQRRRMRVLSAECPPEFLLFIRIPRRHEENLEAAL